jgi:hypothetical protein
LLLPCFPLFIRGLVKGKGGGVYTLHYTVSVRVECQVLCAPFPCL